MSDSFLVSSLEKNDEPKNNVKNGLNFEEKEIWRMIIETRQEKSELISLLHEKSYRKIYANYWARIEKRSIPEAVFRALNINEALELKEDWEKAVKRLIRRK